MHLGVAAYLAGLAIFVQTALQPASTASVILFMAIGILAPVALLVALAAIVSLGMILLSHSCSPNHSSAPLDKFITINDKTMAAKYKSNPIPMEEAFEAYMNGKIDFKADLYTILKEHREELFRFTLNWTHIKFFLFKFVPQGFNHSRAMDNEEVTDVYNRGNDFYNWFLGPTMVYTTGVYETENDTLEEAQVRKMDMIIQKADIKPEHSVLDIGCGWGSLVRHISKTTGAKAVGVTICKEQIAWGRNGIKADGTGDKCRVELLDYRDIPNEKFDRITCVEMAEHVGVMKFQAFLNLVHEHLVDDGIFYLQIAGLRRRWRFEDLIWGIFMGTYIFPAADASTPLGFVVNQLEEAGFELWSVQNVGKFILLLLHHLSIVLANLLSILLTCFILILD
jgi:sphingolipid C9-methyltransferase